VVGGIGMNPAMIAFNNQALLNWFNIISEAKKQGVLKQLIEFALQEYKTDEFLNEAIGQFDNESHNLNEAELDVDLIINQDFGDFEDEEKENRSTKEQLLATKIFETLRSFLVLDGVNSEVVCGLNDVGASGERKVECNVCCNQKDVSVVKEILGQELNVISMEDDIAKLSVYMICTIPANLRSESEVGEDYGQLFKLTVDAKGKREYN